MVLMHINSSFPWRLHIYIYMWFVLFPTKKHQFALENEQS